MNYDTAPDKDPNSKLDHAHEWEDWLEGEAIASFDLFVSDPAVTLEQVAVVGTQVRYRVGGGVVGQNYFVTSRVTTNTGRRDDYTLRYTIADK